MKEKCQFGIAHVRVYGKNLPDSPNFLEFGFLFFLFRFDVKLSTLDAI